ncbi:hypothetical protein ABZU94_08245 [Streptomyces mirabilis]|uniref:hypothetical protein n=1 Tax=Streptomyces sp. NPDC005388 TaxID=3156717 RepID=UPI0033BA7E21
MGRQLLLKYTRDAREARHEVRGRALLQPHYRVPDLYARLRVPGGYVLAYQRLAYGRDRGLLLDLLNDHEPSAELVCYMEALTDAYHAVILHTADLTSPAQLVRKLYWDRAGEGGRLDSYYKAREFTLAIGNAEIPIAEIGRWNLRINGEHTNFDWYGALDSLKRHFQTDEPVWAAVTQGDPTDVNLAVPLGWFDYDTAGMNCILGEFANFLTYTAILGGWLVPIYNPSAFVDHPATFRYLPNNTPHVRQERVDAATRTAHIAYSPRLCAPRRAAVTAYWHQLVLPVAKKLWPGADLAALLRPYVAMRLLGVYNLGDLAPVDRLVLISRLAEALSDSFDPAAFFDVLESPCPAL